MENSYWAALGIATALVGRENPVSAVFIVFFNPLKDQFHFIPDYC